ncbi:MAG: heavy metal translocating P-type ATPase [Lachnospiraceae bacterium]|nr:heavy metal translocating P-type ATPase [Lachnospiraceae bacterium]
MTRYRVTGMSCAACQARVEKAVNGLPGVESCAVSLLTNSMNVEGDADPSAIIKAVENAGYGASLKGLEGEADPMAAKADGDPGDQETKKIRNRLIASLILLVPLMYVSMGHMLFDAPLPSFLDGNHTAMGIYELLLSTFIMVINQRFFISGFKALFHRAPNMDTLVALGSAASYGYSVFALFAMTAAAARGDRASVLLYMDDLYFESAAMILTLITVGKLLESVSKGRTTDALKGLMKLAPKKAVIIRNGAETEVPVKEIGLHDRFVLRPGSSVPVDGKVVEGNGAVDESMLTGESIPVEKSVGDGVFCATINKNGYMVCEAVRIGRDTTLSQIIQMVSDASASKAPIAKIADRVSGVFVPAVIVISLLTFLGWILAGYGAGFSMARAVSVLVISCPCALGLATPVAIMVGSGVGARNGILFKNAAALEETGKVKTVALDKTGTITKGEPEVREIRPSAGVTEAELLETAYALESRSEHPLAKAVCACVLGRLSDGGSSKAAGDNDLTVKAAGVSDFREIAGSGLCGMSEGKEIVAGNREFAASRARIGEEDNAFADSLSEKGHTPLFFSKGDRYLGLIGVCDVIKDDSAAAIEEMKKLGLEVVMLTGDNERIAASVAREAGVDRVIASVKPDEKERVIKDLQKRGKTAMAGDGINDAVALTSADIGIAIGAGSDIAIDAAQVVLVNSSLMDAADAIRLGRATLRNIHENLFWAFFYNVIGIPLAAGAFIPAFGWTLNPMFAAAAMSLSSFCVVTNALRLNLFRRSDAYNKNGYDSEEVHDMDKEEEGKMKIRVNGMMCPKCEAHVKEAIEKIPGVVKAVADHNEALVTLTVSSEVSEDALKKAVEEAGYEYEGIA